MKKTEKQHFQKPSVYAVFRHLKLHFIQILLHFRFFRDFVTSINYNIISNYLVDWEELFDEIRAEIKEEFRAKLREKYVKVAEEKLSEVFK